MVDLHAHPQNLLTVGHENVTGPQLAQRVKELSSRYREIKSPLVALIGESSIDFVAAVLALLEIRKPFAVLSAQATLAEREQVFQILGEFTALDEKAEPGSAQSRGPCDLHPECALVLFTSGSTGQPRAVQLSRRNIEANTKAVIDSLQFAAAREQVLFLPLSYSFGLLGQLLPALQLGVHSTLLNGFAAAPRWIAENGMRGMWSGVPPHWIALLRFLSTQSDLKIEPTHIVSAGGRLDLEVRRQMSTQFATARLFNNYGLTEASPRLLSLPSSSPLFLSDAIGYPVGDWKIRFSADGELQAQGSQMMLGYMHGAESTRIRDGWLNTGDIGHAGEEGCVYLSGRADHLVKVAGERMSLAEVEAALSHVRGVRAACVLTRPHPINGNALEAYLETDGPITRSELTGSLKKLLSTHKIPQSYFRVAALPLNPNGKVDRRKVEDLRASAQTIE